MRQVDVVGVVAVGELQDLHARQAGGPAQLDDVGPDVAEVLGDDAGGRQSGAHGVEKGAARALEPAAFLRRGACHRDLPVARETAEMVDAKDIGLMQRALKADEQIDIVATAEGKLVPASYLKIVQPAEAGVVKEILVREGEAVRQGQVLMRMDASLAESDLADRGWRRLGRSGYDDDGPSRYLCRGRHG